MDDKNYYERTGYVSNSSLSFLQKSPKVFKKYLDGLMESEDKSYFRFGQLVHLKVLEPKEFEDTVLVYDYTVPKSPQQRSFIEELSKNILKAEEEDYLIKVYKNNYTTKESDEKLLVKANKLKSDLKTYFNYLRLKDSKTIISKKELESIKDMEESCRNHKIAKDLLFDLPHPLSRDGEDSHNEYEILWKWGSVKCKSLLDRHIIDYNNKVIKLVDFKTTAKLHDFKSSFYDFKYDRQVVFYHEALLHSLADTIGPEISDWTFEYYIVACDSITHECRVFKIEEEDLIDARKELSSLMNIAEYHITNNLWEHSMEYYMGDGYERL